MNRTKKCCVYRDCDVNSQTHPDLTLFQFPKSEERVARWCELAAIDPADPRPRYMCELHFSRIYLCFSSRRKMLLSMAVPRAYGAAEDDQQEEVQSSFTGEEEHLDEGMVDENDDLATEIVYMDPESIDEDPIEADHLPDPPPSKKRTASGETSTYSKLIKVEQIPAISRSMIVSSSSSTSKASALMDDGLKPITPPKGTILRRVKLKKRPSGASKTIIIKTTTQPISDTQNPVGKATTLTTAEPTVSSSPEKVLATSESDELSEEQPMEQPCSPVKNSEPVASTSNTTVAETASPSKAAKEEKKQPTTTTSSSPVKKDESIYEFIFKGEEYVQLPKAKYYGEQQKLQKRLDQCESEKHELQKKIDYYRRAMKDLKEFLANVEDEHSYDTVE